MRRRRNEINSPQSVTPLSMQTHSLEVQRLAAADLVGMAQCMAIDAEAFPYASIPVAPPAGLWTWVARPDDPRRVVGFVSGTACPHRFYVHGLAIDAASRRLGIGRALLRACVAGARAHGCRSIVLHVGVVNRSALSLYESERFDVTRTIVDFYRPGVYPVRDAYEMVLPLA
jgi:ribosomal protein S18 acetylase RimI-like enzyme